MRSTPEPMIWACDTGQWRLYFDSCQLTIAWASNMKVNQGKAACLGQPFGHWAPCWATSSYVFSCLWAMPVALVTMKKGMHGFYDYGALPRLQFSFNKASSYLSIYLPCTPSGCWSFCYQLFIYHFKMIEKLHALWLVSSSSFKFHKAHCSPHTHAFSSYINARCLCQGWRVCNFFILWRKYRTCPCA